MGESVNPDQGRTAFVPGLLGTLRSELDEGTELDWAFGSLEASIAAVRAAFLSNRLTPHDAASLLHNLRLTGSDGCEWTVGATSAIWYRKRNGSWERTGSPEGIRVVGDMPSWVANGIGAEIAAAENAAREAFGSDEVEKVVVPAPIVVNALNKPERTNVEEEINWLLDEWSASPTALPQAPSVPRVGGTDMPGYIPTMFQPSTGMDQAINAVTGATPPPAQRSQSEIDKALAEVEEQATYRETARDGFVLPQEFFLAPEPVEAVRDALDDEIENTASAWSELRQSDDTELTQPSDSSPVKDQEPAADTTTIGPAPITLDDVLAVGRAAHAAARAREALQAADAASSEPESALTSSSSPSVDVEGAAPVLQAGTEPAEASNEAAEPESYSSTTLSGDSSTAEGAPAEVGPSDVTSLYDPQDDEEAPGSGSYL